MSRGRNFLHDAEAAFLDEGPAALAAADELHHVDAASIKIRKCKGTRDSALGGFAIGAEGATIAFRPSLSLLMSGAVVSVVVGIASGIAPAIQAATVPIVNALREV